MPQKLVDKIPLVLYIPSPESEQGVSTPQLEETAKELIASNDGGAANIETKAADGPAAQEGKSDASPEAQKPGFTEPDAGAPSSYPPPPVIIVHASDKSAEDPQASAQLSRSSSPPIPSLGPSSLEHSSTSASAQAQSLSSSTTQPLPSSIPSASALRQPNPRFAFFKRNRSKPSSSLPSTASLPTDIAAPSNLGSEPPVADDPATLSPQGGEMEYENWEDQWEKSALPFVRLEGNRAVCAICLMDFDEPPKRKAPSSSTSAAATALSSGLKSPSMPGNKDKIKADKHKGGSTSKWEFGRDKSESKGSTTPVTTGTEGGQVEEPEPLRLLECGHVFHVCLFHSSLGI